MSHSFKPVVEGFGSGHLGRETVPAPARPIRAGNVHDDVVLKVSALTVALSGEDGEVPLVDGIDLELRAGRTTVVLGESGSGKSLTGRAALGLTASGMRVFGSVEFGSEDLNGLPESRLVRIRGARIALVPQDPGAALNPFRRVGAQIMEVLRIHKAVDSKAQARARALELLGHVGIADPERIFSSWPHELSGGMKQRVAIAIAVSCRPEVLVADEPTTALDVTVQAQILRLIASLQEEVGMAVLFITHDIGVAQQIADDVAIMYAGAIVERGPAYDVLNRPRHPYTAALLASLPGRRRTRGELTPIPGQPPSPFDRELHGCRFAPRCSYATPRCLAQEPPLVPSGGASFGSATACIRADEIWGAA